MDNSRNRNNRARQRHEDRQKRREMVTPIHDDPSQSSTATPAQNTTPNAPMALPPIVANLLPKLQDLWWYMRVHTPFYKIVGAVAGMVILLVVLSIVFSSQIGYNVWAMGVPLAGKTIDEARLALREAWTNDLQIAIRLDGETIRQVSPATLGLELNADEMARQAKDVRWQGFPFGYEIQPVINSDYGVAQTYLLDLVDTVYIPTYEAGFEWQGDSLVAVAGRPSRELDLILTLENIQQNPVSLIKSKQLDLLTKATQPAMSDSSLFLDQAKTFLTQEFKLIGYDPFTDQQLPWTSTRDEIAKWVAVTSNGLVVRESVFKQFVDAVNGQLRSAEKPRYIDQQEAITQFGNALASGENAAYLRIRYTPTTMEIASSSDWGERISRRLGIPFHLIYDVNQGLDWNQLSIGTVINLPSRDLLLPENPVPSKRIIVDLDRRYLVAYENGQVVMSWRVSIGRTDAPTYPGIFQVLTHSEKAYGSGFSLCGDAGCSQWEMEWFMGIYEVIPGLMNGFHGAVLLPNGAYLDNGQVGNQSTFGCVMANNEQSQQLYDWAETGTIVEIISVDFPPQSDLARQAMDYITQTYNA
jgi:hypothetical protein